MSRIPAASSSGTRDGSSASALAPTSATSWVPGPHQAAAPADQPGERGDGPGGHHVDRADGGGDRPLLGAAPDDPPAQAGRNGELGDDLLQELHAAGHRLHEGQREVRPGQAERDAGQARTAAHVDDAGALRDRLGDGRAVEDVPLPQPRHLARARSGRG